MPVWPSLRLRAIGPPPLTTVPTSVGASCDLQVAGVELRDATAGVSTIAVSRSDSDAM